MQRAARLEFGDWQTPPALARDVIDRVARALNDRAPRAVIEPTCGVGAFLHAAHARFPHAALFGFDREPAYIEAARAGLPASHHAHITVADMFTEPWRALADAFAIVDSSTTLPARGPVWIVGNPPWVTVARLGALGGTNAPARESIEGLRGLDARTGRGNFDVSTWLLLRLLRAFANVDAVIAMLCKPSVARAVIAQSPALTAHGLWRVPALRHFDASVDACLFVFSPAHHEADDRTPTRGCPVYRSLDATEPESTLGVTNATAVPDLDAHRATASLEGACTPAWRSGIKHDCARVMELERDGDALRTRDGRAVEIEPACVYPLAKGTDLVRGRLPPSHRVIVTQRSLGEDTAWMAVEAPRAWAYLHAHRADFEARRSVIYRGRAPFSVFGVGPYSFAPWKVAISGLHKELTFALVGPCEGRPTLLDDTCYFLPFDTESEAQRALAKLRSPAAQAFFRARVFWDAKRPITKALLQRLDLSKVNA